MWKLDTVNAAKNLTAKIPGERLMLHVTSVFSNDETGESVTIPFVIENKQLMDNTLLRLIERLNDFETSYQETPNGEAYTPVAPAAPEPAPAPTAEELAARQWATDYANLEKAQKLEAMASKAGKAVNTERATLIADLATRVDSGFKKEYIDLI